MLLLALGSFRLCVRVCVCTIESSIWAFRIVSFPVKSVHTIVVCRNVLARKLPNNSLLEALSRRSKTPLPIILVGVLTGGRISLSFVRLRVLHGTVGRMRCGAR